MFFHTTNQLQLYVSRLGCISTYPKALTRAYGGNLPNFDPSVNAKIKNYVHTLKGTFHGKDTYLS